jgi:hypothetical protein
MKIQLGHILALILMLTCVALLWKWNEVVETEHFEVAMPPPGGYEEKVINMYKEVLDRQPSANELVVAVRDLSTKSVTWDGLRQHLMDSAELTGW